MKKTNKFHVHVYLVYGLIELEVEADNSEEARSKAQNMSRGLQIRKSDCERIAITFGEEKGG
jgi:hypothetical protein